MSEDWFDVAFVNDDEAILHGRRADQSLVRVVLTEDQRREIEDLESRHHARLQKLLRGIAGLSA